MVVVIGSRNVTVGVSLTRTVAAAGYRAVLERDPASVFDTTCEHEADGLILDAGMGPLWSGIVSLVRTDPAYRFAIVVGTGGAREAVCAFDAGADDYVRLPFDGAEFGSRLKTAEQKLRFVRTSALHIADGPSMISGLSAWTNMEATLTSALAGFLGVACEPIEEHVPLGPVYTVRIKFSLTMPLASVTLALRADASTLSAITGVLLGEPSTDAWVLEDAAKEVLNTLGGAFKREALPLIEFTTGIPELVSDDQLPTEPDGEPFSKHWYIGWGEYAVLVHATLRHNDIQTLPASNLAEGMVLADDLRNPLGMLLAPRGMRLTSSAIKRLTGVLGRRVVVRVAHTK